MALIYLLLTCNLAEYIILRWTLFSFRILKALLRCCHVSEGASPALLISLGCMWPMFFTLQDFSSFSFLLCFWNFTCYTSCFRQPVGHVTQQALCGLLILYLSSRISLLTLVSTLVPVFHPCGHIAFSSSWIILASLLNSEHLCGYCPVGLETLHPHPRLY